LTVKKRKKEKAAYINEERKGSGRGAKEGGHEPE
jgi:hypothetical protein